MKKVTKSALKAKMFEYFRELEKSGEPLIVTDFGKPVLQIIPFKEKKGLEEIFADLKGKARLPDDAVLESTENEWEEE